MGVSLLLLLELKQGRIFKDCGIECLRFFPHLYFPFPSYASSSWTQAPHGLEVDAEKKQKGKPLKKIQPMLLLILFYLVRVRQVTHRYTAEVFSVPTGASALCPCLAPSSWTLRTIPRYCFHGMFLPCPCSGQQPLEIFQDGNVYCVSEVGFLNFNTGAK